MKDTADAVSFKQTSVPRGVPDVIDPIRIIAFAIILRAAAWTRQKKVSLEVTPMRNFQIRVGVAKGRVTNSLIPSEKALAGISLRAAARTRQKEVSLKDTADAVSFKQTLVPPGV